MPFDTRTLPAPGPAFRNRHPRRIVAVWLFCICGMLWVMVGLGGATRLTGSGLSIMEWAPIGGALPPSSNAEWQRLFTLYQQTPQYTLVNEGFGIAGFKQIFWLEWVHRLWGRLLGVAFLVPLVWFALHGMIGRRLVLRLVLLFALGGMQGAVGWFMVASGFFPDTTAVSPYRLVIHLILAITLYAAILWTGLSLWREDEVPLRPGSRAVRQLTKLCCWLVGLTILAGGFVAGLHAGLSYNTFPLMDGQIVPPGYGALQPALRNLTENVAAVQFDHRVLATLAALCVAVTVAWGLASRPTLAVRVALAAMGVAAVVQYALGVLTLLFVVPVALATAHQSVAVLLLTACLAALHLQQRPFPRSHRILIS